MNGRSSGFWVLIILGLAGVSGAGVLETKQAAPAGSKETTTSTAPVESTDVAACKEKDPLQAMLRDYYTTIPSRLSDANIASVLYGGATGALLFGTVLFLREVWDYDIVQEIWGLH